MQDLTISERSEYFQCWIFLANSKIKVIDKNELYLIIILFPSWDILPHFCKFDPPFGKFSAEIAGLTNLT